MTFTTFTALLSALIAVGHVFLVGLLLIHLPLPALRATRRRTRVFLRKQGQTIATIVAVIATISPLVYTHVYHLVPCTLCWYQRIFMFSLALLLVIAQIRKSAADKTPIYVLSALGFCVSLFHYVSQRLHETTAIFDSIGCDSIGMTASCSDFYFLSFGYITIPLMAMTGFALIAACAFFADRSAE